MLDLEEVRRWALSNSNAKHSAVGKFFTRIDTSAPICADPWFPLYLRIVLDQENIPNVYNYWKNNLRLKSFGKEWCSAPFFEDHETIILAHLFNTNGMHYDSFNKILYDKQEMFNIDGIPASNHENSVYKEVFSYNFMILNDILTVSFVSFSNNLRKGLDIYEVLVESTHVSPSSVSDGILTHLLEGYSDVSTGSYLEKVAPDSVSVYIRLLKHPIIPLTELVTVIKHQGFIPMLKSVNLDVVETISELLASKLSLPKEEVKRRYCLAMELNIPLAELVNSITMPLDESLHQMDVVF